MTWPQRTWFSSTNQPKTKPKGPPPGFKMPKRNYGTARCGYCLRIFTKRMWSAEVCKREDCRKQDRQFRERIKYRVRKQRRQAARAS